MLDDLLLLRVWAARNVALGEARSRVAADLRPVAADPSQGRGAWQTAFAAATERLTAAGCLVASGRRGARLHLSDAGRRRVQEVFQIPAAGAPAGAGRRRTRGWAWWRDHHALPLALGGERADTAANLRGALLRRFYLPELPGHRRGDNLPKIVDLLLAKRLGVSQASPGAFRQAALRDWARREPLPAAVEERRPAGRLPEHPASFAQTVVAAAHRSSTGRFGEKKVFIAHVWRGLLADGLAAPDEEGVFKERLIRANTAGQVRLSRADLAGAHDAGDVRASEIEYLGEKFHFVRLD